MLATDRGLQEQLHRVVENENKPTEINLAKLPWEQDKRHYSAFIFVVDALDAKSHAVTAGFIDDIRKKEEFKVGGQYPKFETKKLIVRTHFDLYKHKPKDMVPDSPEFNDKKAKVFDVSCTTGENVADALKFLLEQLSMAEVEDYEKFVWANTAHRLQKPKELEQAQYDDGDDDKIPQYDDIKDLKIRSIEEAEIQEEKKGWKKLFSFW